jgi:hypothetical protein
MNKPDDDETKFNETLKRMLDTKPTPHKKDTGPKPGASRRLRAESSHERSEPVKRSRKAK